MKNKRVIVLGLINQFFGEWKIKWCLCQNDHCERRYHGNEEIRDSARYKISLELDQKLYHLARLQINNVMKADGGEYRAVAKNKHGQGVATINLNFEGGDKLKYEFFFYFYP